MAITFDGHSFLGPINHPANYKLQQNPFFPLRKKAEEKVMRYLEEME
ncbi:MAG TPA: hypothetical protein VFZ33_03620 [Chitinophagaceae bacterium]